MTVKDYTVALGVNQEIDEKTYEYEVCLDVRYAAIWRLDDPGYVSDCTWIIPGTWYETKVHDQHTIDKIRQNLGRLYQSQQEMLFGSYGVLQ